MSKPIKIRWQKTCEEDNYPNAESYLCLIYNEKTAEDFTRRLKRAKISQFAAKDILRASGLAQVEAANLHLQKDRNKIHSGIKLSPILLVRDETNGKVVVADGYHRLCSISSLDEDAVIHCKIV